MRRRIKLSAFWACKFFGVFALFRFLNRRAVRILCYHGIALTPKQTAFRPKLFMNPADFARHMNWIKRQGYRVVPLREAVRQIETGEGLDDSLVITIDDGHYGTYRHAIPTLERYGFPATLYVTTYYVEKQEPIINLLVRYVFWLKSLNQTCISGKNYTLEALTNIGGEGAERRAAVAAELCSAHGVDLDRIRRDRWFHLMTKDEISDVARRGFDIQLHTHRHRWMLQATAERQADIRDNVSILKPLVAAPLEHFCYPSGSFHPEQWVLLRDMGIKSAVTLESGLNYQGASMFGLRRFADGSNVSLIELEAQLSGFMDFATRVLERMRGHTRAASEHTRPAAA